MTRPKDRRCQTRFVLSLDVGSSSVKALLLDSARGRCWSASERCRVAFGPGRAEVRPADWWRATRVAIAAAAGAGGVRASEVGHVALAGNMSSIVLLDGDRRPLRDAILITDTRGDGELAALAPDLRARIVASSSNPLAPSFGLAKLLWLAAHEPEIVSRASTWLAAKDFVRYRLTGELATDASDAYNSLLLDPASLDWNRELIKGCGFDESIFPPVRAGNDLAGVVTAAAARATALRPGVPVSIGLGDMAALAVGVGWQAEPTTVVSLGTSATLLVPIVAGVTNRPGFSVHPVLPGVAWFRLGSLLTGGLALDWLQRLGPVSLSGRRHRPSNLFFLPQLSGRGSPSFASRWRGSILGIEPATDLADIAQALYDAIAFELRSCLEALGLSVETPIIVTGGGSAIGSWNEAIADALGSPVQTMLLREVTAFGAALLAFDAGTAARLVERARSGRLVAPRHERRQHVEERYERYRLASRVLDSFYQSSGLKQEDA